MRSRTNLALATCLASLLASSCWSTVPPVAREPLGADATVAYATTVECHGPQALRRGGCRTTHLWWRLRVGAHTATLEVDNATEVFEGDLDPENAGVPSDFRALNGRDHLVWKCEPIRIVAYPRDADFRYRCDHSADRASHFTGEATQTSAIRCTPTRRSGVQYLDVSTIVFAHPSVEWVSLRCTEGDLILPDGDGYRIAE